MPQKERWERGIKNTGNNGWSINLHIQKAQQTPSMVNSKRSTLEYTVINQVLKNKTRIRKAEREKWLATFKRSTMRLIVDFSLETMEARRWNLIFSAKWKKKTYQLRVLYSAKQSFKKWRNSNLPRQTKTGRVCC